jgi:hypothetical protein
MYTITAIFSRANPWLEKNKDIKYSSRHIRLFRRPICKECSELGPLPMGRIVEISGQGKFCVSLVVVQYTLV